MDGDKMLNVSRRWIKYVLTLLKWVIFSVVVGVVVGYIGAQFHHGIDFVGDVREHHGWILYLMPFVGLLIVFFYRVTDMSDDLGTEYIIRAARDGKHLRIRTAVLIFVATILTHFCGGSSGREGAALQLGGCISNFLGRLVRLDDKDECVITMCGMAAGFSALFGTPLAAAVMAMEVVSVGVMYYTAIVPCVLAAVVAQFIASTVGVEPTTFYVRAVPEVTVISMGQTLVLGILCAVAAIVFCVVMHAGPKFYNKITKNPYLKILLGSVILVVLSLIFGRDYNGAGVPVIERALEGLARPEAFLLKLLFTSLTLGAGFKGGEIVPAFFCGATLGSFLGPILGLPASFGAAASMAAVFCGVTNCPLTSILLSYELFGGDSLPLYALCCAVSFMLSGHYSLYHSQVIRHSKLRMEKVNRHGH